MRTQQPLQPLVPNLSVGVSELPRHCGKMKCIHKDVKYSVTVSEKATFFTQKGSKTWLLALKVTL